MQIFTSILDMFWFQAMPSLKINFRKLEIIPLSEVHNTENLMQALDYWVKALPASYLKSLELDI